MRLSLHHRIVLPFAAVALVATAAVALVALSVTSTTLATHINRDVTSATAFVSGTGAALSPSILASVRQVTGADAVTFGPGGVIVTTLTGDGRNALVERVIAGARGLTITEDAPTVVELPGEPSIFIAYRLVEGQPGTVVALLHENAEIERANRLLMRTILGAAAMSILLMIFVSQIIARRVTAPIARLAAFAQDVSASKSPGRAQTGSDEVGRLGAAFNDMLERLDRAQASVVKSEKLGLAGLFAARVAHDVRNPLSSIKMQTQLLHAGLEPGSEAREMTEAMLHDIKQVEFVVKGLLDLARPEHVERLPCQLNDVVSGVIRQIAPQCRHRHITLTSHLAEDTPEMRLDPDRLSQALLNIAVNAMEALREGGNLQISSRIDNAGTSAVIEVDDDGVGLAEGAAARIFDPFVTTKPGGVGLGLVNARAIVESHHGTITLVARTPTGTRATITLPIQ